MMRVSRNVDRDQIDTSYMWEVMKEGKIVYYIDGKNDEQANWLKYVNCSRGEDNTMAVFLDEVAQEC